MIPIPKPIKPLAIKTSDSNLWIDGVVTALDEGRLGIKALTSAVNMILDQDGTMRERPSLQLFGPQPTGNVLGKLGKFKINDGVLITRYEVIVQVVSGVANLYIAKPEDTEWTIVDSGVTFDTSIYVSYFQIAQKLMILQTGQQITYLDLTTVPSSPTLVRFDEIDDPTSAPTLTPTGLTGSTDTIWYGYAYNSAAGTTAVSPSQSQNISTDRSQWDPTSMSVAVDIGTIPMGVASWNLYCATTQNGVGSPTLLLIAGGLSPSNSVYTDNGSAPQILNTAAPTFNSTKGPTGGYGVNIGGRAFIWWDGTYNISIGGDPGFELDFSVANGGDSVPCGAGEGNLPTVVWNFRNGPGDPQIKVMTQEPEGKRHTLAQQSVTYSGTQLEVWGITEDYGFNGTSAPVSLVSANNNSYYLASDGIYSTGTVPDLQNLLSSDSVTQTISLLNDFNSINQGVIQYSDFSYFQHRLYCCLPIDSPINNQIWVLDFQRGGAWMKPWNIPCQGITTLQDNESSIHQLFLVNNQILQSTYDLLTNDNGVVFPTGAGTGVIGFSADLRTWAQVIKLVIVVLRGQGTINFTVTGFTLDSATTKQLEVVGTGQFQNIVPQTGYGWNSQAWNKTPLLKWNDFYEIPSSEVALMQDVDISIQQQLRYFIVSMSTNTAGCDFNISNMIPEFVVVGIKNLL